MGDRVWIGVLAAGALVTSGCMQDGLEEAPWVADLEAEAARMDAALDNVETRLLSGRTQVTLWTELAERHRTVSEIACSNAETHMESISKHFAKTEEVLRKKKRRGRSSRVEASLPPGNSTSGVGGPEE